MTSPHKNTRLALEVSGLALGLVMFVSTCHAVERRGAAEAAVERWRETADSLADVVADREAALVRVDSAAEVRIAEAIDGRQRAERRAAQAAEQQPAAVSGVVAAWGDSVAVRDAVERLQRLHKTEVENLRAVIANADAVIRFQREQIAARDRLMAEMRAENAALRELAAAYEDAGPSWLERASRFALAAGVGVVAWEIAR